ncbi:GPW/gp25 family protein [Candidatus Regiella insecticola]|uniref:Baseplate assembly protein n=1 Tax=Candidatus Regiella insecticola TaxID=138073 RepID=A0A6L2ZTB2_9ENTR|nr:GPW/gp25 family protein [Candidatus Regiella insecticola]GFN47421.1 baseplate assembly protein [Candidatus Regiella insecticola]
MRGTNALNGKPLSGLDHLRQSVKDILTTPIGARVMRRDYGSELFRLIDAPLNDEILVRLYAATAEALALWEPRLRLLRVQVVDPNGQHRINNALRKQSIAVSDGGIRSAPDSTKLGRVTLCIEGIYLPDEQRITLNGISLNGLEVY